VQFHSAAVDHCSAAVQFCFPPNRFCSAAVRFCFPSNRFCSAAISLSSARNQSCSAGGSALEGLAAAPEEAQRFRQACREVRERAEQTLGWAIQHLGLLGIALDHLSLGRSHLGLALTAAGPATPGGEAEADFAQAAEHLSRAVEGLRQAGYEEVIARGLLARAAFHRLRGNLTGAEADLAEALEIAERGGMRLHLCDAHLEGARLARRQGDENEARRHLALARKLVVETGYGRRKREVRWLEGGGTR
jgi:hypothetical protein